MTGPEVVTLRTGTEVPGPLARIVTLVLEQLMDTDPIALYEAVMMARQPGHIPFGNTAVTLKRHELIGIYPNLHGSVRDIILAAAEGEGAGLHLVSPYASGGGLT